jgi:hypothetical protein
MNHEIHEPHEKLQRRRWAPKSSHPPALKAAARQAGSTLHILPALNGLIFVSFRGFRGSNIQPRRLAETIQPVPETQNRVPPEQARTGITHDRPHLLAPVALITMHRAVGAGGLAGSKPATVQPHGGIIQKALALRTKRGAGAMKVPAIAPDHRRQGFPFPRQAFAGREVGGQWQPGRPRHFRLCRATARRAVRAATVLRAGGGQRTARPTEVCSCCH